RASSRVLHDQFFVTKGPMAMRPALRQRAYLAVPPCMALLRWAAHSPILPFSNAPCASDTSFCATALPAPSAMASTADSVLARFSPLQPALTFAALAGQVA